MYWTDRMVQQGKVYLVGAGPGDPRLITVKGVDVVKASDTILYDALVAAEILAHARPEAEKIYVGKRGHVGQSAHQRRQIWIDNLMVDRARRGLTVCRLKGGDPCLFGRAGEEAEKLRRAGIEFEIVPGVTSALAVPAYAGIPVTDRRHASVLTIATGSEDNMKDGSSLDWTALAGMNGTLVFLMGVRTLPDIVRHLVAHGKEGSVPCAVIAWGCTPRQRTVTGTLATIVETADKMRIVSPAVLVMGEVVRLRESLAWFTEGNSDEHRADFVVQVNRSNLR